MLLRSALAWTGGGGGIAGSGEAAVCVGGEASPAGSPGTPPAVVRLLSLYGERGDESALCTPVGVGPRLSLFLYTEHLAKRVVLSRNSVVLVE